MARPWVTALICGHLRKGPSFQRFDSRNLACILVLRLCGANNAAELKRRLRALWPGTIFDDMPI